MENIRLGNTELSVNRIGFGGIPIQRLDASESDVIIRKAMEAGINFFDTSRIYTDSEEKIGRILPEYRNKIIIATKTYSRDAQHALEDLETSLTQLHTDYIDLYQFHNVSNQEELKTILGPKGALESFLKAKISGKIRYIGITGHKPWILAEALNAFAFDTVQFPFNIIEASCLESLMPLAKNMGAGIIAMKPMAGGAIQNTILNLRYILANGADVAIPGMDKVWQIEENLGVLQDGAPLSPTELETLQREKEELGQEFCRRCEYCMPCPQGLPIPFLHLLGAYYFRYQLKSWVWERIRSLGKTYEDCISCNECIKKCPYSLDTPTIFRKIHQKMLADRENKE